MLATARRLLTTLLLVASATERTCMIYAHTSCSFYNTLTLQLHISGGLRQNRGFETGYEAARKIEMDLQREVVHCKKQTTLDNFLF